MTITYIWKVTGMKVKDINEFNDVVIQTYWEKKGIDEEGNEGIFSGTTPLTFSSNTTNFVEYSNLTQDIVLSWIIPIADSNHVDQQIMKQIENKKNPIKEISLPWVEISNNDVANN